MAGYAPGTGPYEEAVDRRARHSLTRRQNMVDLFMGLGQIGQALGQARRAREAEADRGVEAQMLGRVYSEPVEAQPSSVPAYQQMPQVLGGGVAGAGNNYVEMPQERQAPDMLQEEILGAGGAAPSFWQNLANTFSFGSRGGRLSPEAQMRLLEARRGLRGDAARTAASGREESRRDAELELKREELGVRRGEAGAKAYERQQADDISRLDYATNKHLDAQNRMGSINTAITRARAGTLTAKDFLENEVFKGQIDSNPVFAQAMAAAEGAGVSPEAKARAFNDLANELEALKGQQALTYEATKPAAQANLEEMNAAAARRMGRPYNESEFEAHWRARNGAGSRTLSVAEEDAMAAEYERHLRKVGGN